MVVWLSDNAAKWGNTYAAKKNNPTKKDDFQWATYKGNKVNVLLIPILKDMTQNHCSFCDSYPLETIGVHIEHFEPVSSEPAKSYLWENLFYCCPRCNEHKKDPFDLLLLKPDADNYDFSYYFIFNFSNGLLMPNKRRTLLEQHSALKTIELYGLNEYGRPEIRLREIEKYVRTTGISIDEFQFRFILEMI